MNNHIYLPNEIFDDFKNEVDMKNSHIPFSYSYYYYISYLYRYCEWYREEKVTQTLIKQKLQYSPNEKRVNYLIKKDGILDNMGYTLTTIDYPIAWTTENGFVEFTTIEEHNRLNSLTTIITDRAFKVKSPVKCFFRSTESQRSRILDGTFYDVENTHKIDYDVFEKCMNNESLGVYAFYIYGYIKSKNGTWGEYKLSSRNVVEELAMAESTFKIYINALEENGLMKVRREKFKGHKGWANGYATK